MVKEYVSGSAMTFERNPNYWETATIEGKEYQLPFVDKLIFPIITDESTQIAALRTGRLDILHTVPTMYEDTLARTSPELIKYGVIVKPQVIALNMQSEILSNRDVRRALMIAVDREAINKAVWGPGGDWNAFPVASIVPDVWTPIDELPASAQETLVYDPVKAKQMLVKAGYPDGFSLKMILNAAVAANIDIASMVKGYWAEVGVTLRLDTMEATAYTRLLWGKGSAGTPGVLPEVDYDTLIQGDAPHDAPIRALGNSFTPSGRNFAHYYSDDFMEQFNLAMKTVDEAERNAILKKLNVIGLDATAYIPIGSPAILRYWWPWVKNYYGEADVGTFYMGPIIARMWIDRNLKAKLGY